MMVRRNHRSQNLRTALILISTFAALFVGSVIYIVLSRKG
jgi:hypothetical protein